MKKLIPAAIISMILLMSLPLLAQDTTTTATQETSNVTILYVACQDQGVITLSGVAEAGYDVYYQFFSSASGGGQALTSLRQVAANGSFSYSERIVYNSGFQLTAGSTGSAYVAIARETDPTNTIYETTVNDLQDGCSEPTTSDLTSTDAGSGVSTSTTPTNGILSPFGGVINSNFLSSASATPLPPVVIGAPITTVGRSDTPGVIFAECNMYPDRARPGILYDTDSITLFWSWFARTEAQVQDHMNNANYDIKFNTAPLNYVDVSAITQRTSNYWVFYTAPIGRLTPGRYGIEFRLTWDNVITDGFDDYGPGTDNLEVYSNCTFDIQRNPFGEKVENYNLMYSRPQ